METDKLYYYLEQTGNTYSDEDISRLIGSEVLSYSTSRKNDIGLYFAQYTIPRYNKYTETTAGYTWVKNGVLYIQTWNIVSLSGIELTNATNNAKIVVATEIQRRLDEISAWNIPPESKTYYQEYINQLIALPTQPTYPVQLAIDVDNQTFANWPVAPSILGAVESLETSTSSTTVPVQDVYTVVNTDTNVYNGSTYIPQPSPTTTSGWYFKNSTLGDTINWVQYTNSGTSSPQNTFNSLTSIWAIVEFNVTTSNPYLMITSQPTGTGDVNPAYHSLWQYDDYLVAPSTTGKYLVYWGEDPNVRRELPRVNITQVQGASSAGDRATTEVILSITLETSATSTANAEEFTVLSSGYIFNGRVAINNYVITGQYETNADIAFSRILAYTIPGTYPDKTSAMTSAVGVYGANGSVDDLYNYAYGILVP